MKRKKTPIRRIFEHEACRIRGHAWVEYQIVHHRKIEEGMWSALVDEVGKECARCDVKSEVKVASR